MSCESYLLYAVGDSLTTGYGITNEVDKYVNKIGLAKKWHVINKAVNGSKIAHMVKQAYAITIDEDTKTVMNGSGNDAYIFQLDQNALNHFKPGLMAVLAWLAIPNSMKVLGNSTIPIYMGTWTVIQDHANIGKWSQVQGDTASFQLTGTTLYIATLVLSGSASGGGSLKITIDGNDYGTYTQQGAPSYGANSNGGATNTPFLIRIPNLTDSVHNVVLTNLNGGYIYFEWACGLPVNFVGSPSVWMGNTHYQVNPLIDPGVIAYNKLICEGIETLSGDGLNINLINIARELNLWADYQADGTHLNIQGHQKIADKFLEIIP